MAKGAQCAESGPFFPTTPRMIIQNGIAIDSKILITPDWLYIGLMLGLFFVLVIILAVALVCVKFLILYYLACLFSIYTVLYALGRVECKELSGLLNA